MKIDSMLCMKCNKKFSPSFTRYVCDVCGTDGILDIIYDYSDTDFSVTRLKNDPEKTLWRYMPLLPIPDGARIPPLAVGMTPLYRAEKYEKKYGISRVMVKDDGRNPTASLKDRASAIGITLALNVGAKAVCAASTGNAASSLAGFAASVGMKTYIFVPRRAPKAKIAQLLIYGANTIIVDDTYDKAFDLSVEFASRFGYYNRNCAYNPYLVEGKKTVSFEIWEQLNYDVPDRIYVSIGDGCITSSIYKGFYDLKQLRLIEKIPRIIAVQAEKCNPIEKAFRSGKFEPQNPDTIADSIAVGIPRNRLKALRALKNSNGDCISVSDDDIRKSLVDLPRDTGVFGEPAGVTAHAGFIKHVSACDIKPDEKVVILVTGNGLKDIDTAMSSVTMPEYCKPDIEHICKHVASVSQA